MEIPHCPNPRCDHFSSPPGTKWYSNHGFHATKAFGSVARFRCRSCGKTFSTQTFSIDYYAKKLIDYSALLEQLATASGMNDMGRRLKVRVETIENRLERLARCAIAIHGDLLKLLPMKEDFAADGFESFSYSQYYPHHVNIFTGCQSEFIYVQGFSNLRRKGRMTVKQKEKRELLEKEAKADPKAIEKSFITLTSTLMGLLSRKNGAGRLLFTDEHKAYVRAFGKIPAFPEFFCHIPVSSQRKRTKENPLFPVNYIDRQIRKDLSDHVRETIQFAKCPSAMMARMSVYRFFHNCCIPHRIRQARKGNSETHAERAGILPQQLQEVIDTRWGKRSFLHKLDLEADELKTWFCRWANPGKKIGRFIPRYIGV